MTLFVESSSKIVTVICWWLSFMGWKLKLNLSLHDKKNMKFFEKDSSLWVIHSDANGTDTVQSVVNTLTIAELNFRISGHIADSCFLTGNV